MRERTDPELVALARAGQKRAFDTLVSRHAAAARRVAARLIQDDESAQELVQEAVLQAYLGLAGLREASCFGGWLCGITANLCRSHLRDQKRTPLSWEMVTGGIHWSPGPSNGAVADPQQAVERRELHDRILGALDGLSPRVRHAAVLFYLEGLDLRETAVVLETSVAAVKVRLYQARKTLRRQLLPDYPELAPMIVERKTRRKKMVPVTVSEVLSAQEGGQIIMLLSAERRRALPIWIGIEQAVSIVAGIHQMQTQRPLTYRFMAEALQAAGASLDQVTVHELKENIFYAAARFTTAAGTRELDARPSDAIALALHTGSPVYVAEAVLEEGGVDVPEGENDLVALMSRHTEKPITVFELHPVAPPVPSPEGDPPSAGETLPA